MKRPVVEGWREVDPHHPHFGGYVQRHGLTVYLGRRCYRLHWRWAS